MAKSYVDSGTLAIGTSDTYLVEFNSLSNTSRYAITNLVLYNTTGSDITVSIYRSPTLVIAEGFQLDTVVVPANGVANSDGVVNLSPNTNNLILNATGTGVNATATLITFGTGE